MHTQGEREEGNEGQYTGLFERPNERVYKCVLNADLSLCGSVVEWLGHAHTESHVESNDERDG